jgi:hypothetical protein
VINFRFWYSWGSWWTSQLTYKFRYDGPNFNLIGFDSFALHRATMESNKYSVNFLTRKYEIVRTVEDEDGNTNEKIERKTFELKVLKTLQTLGTPLQWDFDGEVSI